MKKSIFFILFVNVFFSNLSFSQYQLSDEQLVNGFNYLKVKIGFKNPSSVQYNSHISSKNKYKRECFTWAKYDVSAQNSFGGYERTEVIVYFFNGKPISADTKLGFNSLSDFPDLDKTLTDEYFDTASKMREWGMDYLYGECIIQTPTPTPISKPSPKPTPKAKPKTTSKGKL
jgi:hypothetical protein